MNKMIYVLTVSAGPEGYYPPIAVYTSFERAKDGAKHLAQKGYGDDVHVFEIELSDGPVLFNELEDRYFGKDVTEMFKKRCEF